MPTLRLWRLAALCTGFPTACTRSYDVVIENGRLVDGTVNAWAYPDLAIRGDKIVAIAPRGALRSSSAKHWIDAHAHIVAPGFIDVQNHSWDNVLWKDGRVPSLVTQGVTSVILGEAATPAPSNDKLEELEEIATMDTIRARLQRSFRGEHGFKN
jgi:N-acyl-D-amino-acid deacylase